MKQVLFAAAILVAPFAAFAADAPHAAPALTVGPAASAATLTPQLTAEDARNLLVLLSRTQMQGSEVATVARLMAILNGIAEKK